jgi:ELWxxDGT repeat protein
MRTKSLAFAALTLLPALISAAWAQPAFMVKDIGETVSLGSLALGGRVELDGVLYFPSDDGIHGTELWRSDGTAAGTWLIRDLCPGFCSSSLRSLTAFQHRLYWSDLLLWTSDGTAQGTVPFPGPEFPAAGHGLIPLGNVGGRLLLSGENHDNSQGELWTTDGTAAGTVRIREFSASTGGYFARPFSIGQSGSVLFFATGYRTLTVWATDGTLTGTVPLYTSAPDLSLRNALVAGGRLFFEFGSASTSVAWVSDGTLAGTQPLAGVSFGSDLTALGSQVLFVRGSYTAGWELWKSDGTVAGTSLLKAFEGVFRPETMTAIGSQLFFSRPGGELWASDGTAAGTRLVRQFFQVDGLLPFGDRLAFFAEDGSHGVQAWLSDGTPAGTDPVVELQPGSTVGRMLGVLGGRLLFEAGDSRGWFLWASDGTPGSLSRVSPLDTQTSSFPWLLADLGGTLLFSAVDAASDLEAIWRTDGSAAETFQVKTLPGLGGFAPYPLARIGNHLFFAGSNSLAGYNSFSLWETDGTAAGTLPVPQSSPLVLSELAVAKIGTSLYLSGSSPGQSGLFKTDGTDAGTVLLHTFDFTKEVPQQVTAAGDRLFFRLFVRGGLNDSPLWTSDGTVTGTEPIFPRRPLHDLGIRGALGSRLLFTTEDAARTKLFLWTSDGTAAGTHRIARIADRKPGLPGEATPLGTPPAGFLAVAAGRAFFAGDDDVHGDELWSTDGTVAGTGMVADVARGASGSSINSLTAVGKRVFFTADDGIHGRELWTSDGTAAGTHMVADIVHGSGSSQPENLTAVDGLLLFSADDGVHGVEAWVSDGTRRGTRMLQDIAAGPLPSSPSGFRISGGNVYFSATDAVHGFELWAVPREALAPHQ